MTKIREIFETATQPKAATEARDMKRKTGLKDRFTDFFMEKIIKRITGKTDEEANKIVGDEMKKIGTDGFLSPVWKILGKSLRVSCYNSEF